VRVHTHSLAEDVFGIGPSRELIDGSLRAIAQEGHGAFIYLHSGTRGFAIDRAATPNRIVFQREQRAREHTDDRSCRTLRQVGLGGQILSDLGIHKIRLLTNTPTHVPALQGFGIEIVEQVPLGAVHVVKA
jgi:3,4-dihydroxy 2-butanone 4-phosphate synthase/GTP cyclohydrolase II